MEEVYEDALEGEMESQLQAYSQGVQFHPAQPCHGLAPVCDPTSDEFRADGVLAGNQGTGLRPRIPSRQVFLPVPSAAMMHRLTGREVKS